MLPSGLRSASKIVNAVVDALEWCVVSKEVLNIFNYLADNFVVVGPPDSENCHQDLMILKQFCIEPGVPLAQINEKDLPQQYYCVPRNGY